MKRIIRPNDSPGPETLHTDVDHRVRRAKRSGITQSGWFDARQWVRTSSSRPALLLSLLGAIVVLGASYAIFAATIGSYGYSISSVNALPPTNMAPNQAVTVSFTLKNTGSSTWYRNLTQDFGQFNLGTTGGNCACLPASVDLPVNSVPQGQTVKFNIAFTAPSSPGTFSEQYKIHILNKGDLDPVPININFRTTVPGPPGISMTGPANGSTVSGTATASANASVGAGVSLVGVQFRIDGRSLGAEDTSAPYAVSFDTHSVANGTHSINALARDSAGRSTTSNTLTFTVNNPSGGGSGGGGGGGSSGGSHGGGGGSTTVTGPFVSEAAPSVDTTAPDITSVVPEVSQPVDNTQNTQPIIVKPKGCNFFLASLSGGLLGDAICSIKHLVVK